MLVLLVLLPLPLPQPGAWCWCLLLPEPRHCFSLPRQGLQALVVNRPHHLPLPPLLLLLQMTSRAVRGITGNVRAQLYQKYYSTTAISKFPRN